MTIDYVVTQTTVLDPFNLRVVVDIRTPHVINGYGGGCITLTVPVAGHRTAIEEAVIKKFTREVSPQEHDLVLNGDCTKVELVQEELELAAAQRKERERELERISQTERAPEGKQEQPSEVAISSSADPDHEANQDLAASVDADPQTNVPSALEESSKE